MSQTQKKELDEQQSASPNGNEPCSTFTDKNNSLRNPYSKNEQSQQLSSAIRETTDTLVSSPLVKRTQFETTEEAAALTGQDAVMNAIAVMNSNMEQMHLNLASQMKGHNNGLDKEFCNLQTKFPGCIENIQAEVTKVNEKCTEMGRKYDEASLRIMELNQDAQLRTMVRLHPNHLILNGIHKGENENTLSNKSTM